MASRLLAFIVVLGVLIQTVYPQCVNRGLPTCAQNIVETLLPNPVLYREPTVPVLPAPLYPTPVCSGPIIPEVGIIAPSTGYAPTIIQDSSVANSLANALQLLVVSNLLSTTLPGPCDVPAYPYDVLGVPAYNYVY